MIGTVMPAAEIHAAAEKAGAIPCAQRRGDRPVHAAPAQEEQRGRQQHDDDNGIADISHGEHRDSRDQRREAEQRTEHEVGRAAACPPGIADQTADKPGEEDDEGRAAQRLDVEAVHLEKIGRHPGQEPVEHSVEEHPAAAHQPDRAEAEIGAPVAARGRRLGVFRGMRRLDEPRLSLVNEGMLARRIADVPPRQEPAQERADAGDQEGRAP
jgi:hypothetical protein